MMSPGTGPGINIKRNSEFFKGIFNNAMIPVDNILRGNPFFLCLYSNGHSMLIRPTDKNYFFTFLPQITDINVRRHIHSGQMTDMNRPVCIR